MIQLSMRCGKSLAIWVSACLLLSCLSLHAQQPKPPAAGPGKDSLKVVQIISADRYGYKKLDSVTELLVLVGNVALKQENTLFYGDSAVFNRSGKIVEAFGNVHINDNDSIDTYSDYLLYHTDTKIALLQGNVKLTDGKSNLLTDELEYDVNQKTGIYRKGGKVVNGTSVLTSKEGTYYADVKDVHFKYDVVLNDPKYNLRSDSLLYNTESEVATFISKTFIQDSAKRNIETDQGFYDLKSKVAQFGGRPIVKDGATTTIANNIDTNDSTGITVLTGNAVFHDTAQGVSVLANSIVTNRDRGSLLATQHPLMIIKQDNDSTFIAADTLYSGRLSELDSTVTDSVSVDSLKKVPVPIVRKVGDSAAYQPPIDAARQKEKDTLLRLNISPDTITRRVTVEDTIRQVAPRKKNGRRKRAKMRARQAAIVQDSSTTAAPPGKNKPVMATPAPVATRIPDTTVPNRPLDTATAKPGDTAAANRRDTATSNQNDSAGRFFRAYHKVRIFSDSLQAVCDSLFYSGKDSIFRLFRDPIIWANNSQVTGDTIYMYTKNKKPNELHVFEDGMMINKTGENMYNQVKGIRLYGYFRNGEIDYVRARGSAESVYYAKDSEDKLIGINKASSDVIDMRFKNKELNRVVYISAVTGTMLPYREATEQDKRLRDFNWQDEKRPKSKFELFEN